MARIDHLGITVDHVPSASAQFDPVLAALGYRRTHDAEDLAFWTGVVPEILLYPAREEGSAPHRHGRVGWQHLAYRVESRAEVDRIHRVALSAGWSTVREPKEYPRFTPEYYASFVEDDNGIRLEVFHDPQGWEHPSPDAENAADADGGAR